MNSREIIQQSLDYIERNLKAEITADELCSAAGYSYAHYCRLFRISVGMPPVQYINRRKLIHAVYEIANGAAKIDAALSYGFETYAGFYKAFRREYGCSPSEFIKKCKGESPYRINILQEEHIMISKTKIKKILSVWNSEKESISNIFNENTGRRSENAFYVGDDYVIKYTPDLAKIKNHIRISAELSRTGLPAAAAVKTPDGEEYIQDGELFFMLTERIKGSQLKCGALFENPALAIKIGESIGRLHLALKNFDESDYNSADIYKSSVSALESGGVFADLPNGFIDKYKDEFGCLYKKLPRQLIHRDINPQNMIFDNGEFSGFIDFDLTEVNIRIFDICYAATSILSESFKDEKLNKDVWLDIFKNIADGYNSVGHLTDDEKEALPFVVYANQIICIAYFSKFEKYKRLYETNVAMLCWLINKLPL